MNGRMKALSAVLAIVAIIGLVAGGMTVSDVLAARTYWEDKSAESEASLGQLEDGLNQLQDNEKAYLEGRETLADGKIAYEEGKQTLADGYAEYAQGQQDYADGLAQYNAGKKTLESKTAAFNAGKVQKVQAKQVYDAVNKLMNGYSPSEAVATVASATGNSTSTIETAYAAGQNYDATVAQLQSAKAAYEAVKELMDGYSHEKAIATVAAQTGNTTDTIEQAYAAGAKYDETVAQLAAAKQAYDAVSMLENGASQAQAIGLVAQATGQSTDTIATAYQAGANYDATKAQLDAKEAQLTQAKAFYDGVQSAMQAYGLDEATAISTVAGQKGLDTDTANALYAAGKNYDKSKAELDAGKAQLESAKKVYDNVQTILSINTHDAAVAYVANATGQSTATVEQGYAMGNDTAQAAAKAQLEQAKAAYDAAKKLEDGYTYDEAVATVAAATGNSTATVEQGYAMGNPTAQKQAYAQLEQAKSAYDAVVELENGYSYDKAIATVAASTGKDTATIKKGYENGNPKAQKAIQAQLDEYTAGQAKLKAAEKELAAGRAKLADAEVQLAEGEKSLADAEKQIKEGEEQLAVFEDGAEQVKAGIQQVVDTEADGDLVSIADRLGSDYKYVDANGDLIIPAGFTAVDTAREYSSDSGVAIEGELYGRIYAIIATLIASVMAIIASILAFTKKYKGAIPCGVISAIAAIVATVLANKAGMVFSTVAGSTLGGFAIYAGIILAVVAAVHAIASGMAAGSASKADGAEA